MKPYHLVVPLAGRGQRMIDGGYVFPKPMILVGEQHIVDWSMKSIDTSECEVTFVVRRDHVLSFAIDALLRKKYGPEIEIVISDGDTRGSVATVCLARERIADHRPLIIYCPDVTFTPRYVPRAEHFQDAGFLLTFKANSANYSYAQLDQDGYVTKTAEKLVISDNASVGIYGFASGQLFLELADAAMQRAPTFGTEYYVCPLYNDLIANGGKVTADSVEKLYVMGTPEEMDFFKTVVWPFLLPRSFVLCSDHSGFEQKELAKRTLSRWGVRTIDAGCFSSRDCDYGDYVTQAIATARLFPGAFVLGFCRSGQGVNIAASKHAEVRAALVFDERYAELAIRHNAANFFSIPAAVDPQQLERMLAILHSETFDGGRHQNRLMKIPSTAVGTVAAPESAHATASHPDDAERLVHRPLHRGGARDPGVRGGAPLAPARLPWTSPLPRGRD